MSLSLNIGEIIEGVLLETFVDHGSTRPRVKPIGIFDPETRVEFPVNLRKDNPIGTKFIADVKVCQKHSNNKPYGKPYLVAKVDSIELAKGFKPTRFLMPIRLNTPSKRSYIYVEYNLNKNRKLLSFKEFRGKLNEYHEEIKSLPLQGNLKENYYKELIKSYAYLRAKGVCEACNGKIKRNDENEGTSSKVHLFEENLTNVSELAMNVILLCSECFEKISNSSDKDTFNANLKTKIVSLEQILTDKL